MSPPLQFDVAALWVVTLRALEGAETLTGVALSKAATWYEYVVVAASPVSVKEVPLVTVAIGVVVLPLR